MCWLRACSASARGRDDLSAFSPRRIAVFFEILVIDIVLAGDNAIVVGRWRRVAPAQRKRSS